MPIVTMPAIISSNSTECCVRSLLEIEGYQLSSPRASGETGVDILAQKGRKRIYIEVIGYKAGGPARAKDFFQAFFRAISRIKDGAKYCVIAMPSLAERGLSQRAHQYGVAWIRIGEAFPELQIWLVDTDSFSYEETSWNYWLK